MIVVVETNFILQWVFQQEQSAACEEIFRLCESGRHSLRVPAFAVAEAGMRLERRRSDRRKFLEHDFERQLEDSRRAKPLQQLSRILNRARAELVRVENQEDSRWRTFRARTGVEGTLIPLDDSVLEDSVAVQIGREIKQFPDALVFASVRIYLEGLRMSNVQTPAIFVTTDDDFITEPALRQLRKLDCKLIRSFGHAASRLRSDRQ